MSIFPCFLTDSFADYDDDNPDGRAMPGMDMVLDHIAYAVKVAGVESVGLGTDYDGINHTAKGLESIEKFPLLVDGLKNRGFCLSDIEKMAFQNVLRVISSQK